MADDEQKVNVIKLVAKMILISDYAGSYFVEFLAHLVGLSHHWHQLDVVIEDRKQEGIRLTGSRTRLTYAHNVTLSLNILNKSYCIFSSFPTHRGGCLQLLPVQTGSSRSRSCSSHPRLSQRGNQWTGRCSLNPESHDPKEETRTGSVSVLVV